jgi:hypothetical protein
MGVSGRPRSIAKFHTVAKASQREHFIVRAMYMDMAAFLILHAAFLILHISSFVPT